MRYFRNCYDGFLWQSLKTISPIAFNIQDRNRNPDICLIWYIKLHNTSVGHGDQLMPEIVSVLNIGPTPMYGIQPFKPKNVA
jgi:hypothetical protein